MVERDLCEAQVWPRHPHAKNTWKFGAKNQNDNFLDKDRKFYSPKEISQNSVKKFGEMPVS